MARKRGRRVSRTKRARKRTRVNDGEGEEKSDPNEENDEYEVEDIRGRRGNKYLVKWKGYNENTWEAKENLQNCDELIRQFEAKNQQCAKMVDVRAPRKSKVPINNPAEEATDVDICNIGEETKQNDVADIDEETKENDIADIGEVGGDASADGKGLDGASVGESTSSDAGDSEGVELPSTDMPMSSEYIHLPAVGNKPRPSIYRVYASSDDDSNYEDVQADVNDSEDAEADVNEAAFTVAAQVTTPKAKKVVPPKKPSSATASQSQASTATILAGGIERSLMGKMVAFSPRSDRWLNHKTYAIVGSTFIIGRICLYHFAKKQGLYEIRWLDSMFQNRVEKVDLSIIKQGRQNYEQLQEQLKASSDTPKWRRLIQADSGCELDTDDLDHLVEFRPFKAPESVPVSIAEVEGIKNMNFDPNGVMRCPDDLFTSERIETHVKPEFEHLFEHSASACFFAYLPLYFWKQVLQHTSDQAKAMKLEVGDPLTMQDIMTFLGILWFMSVVDKGEYANYWGEQMESAIFATASSSLDTVMPLRRFKMIRTAFCFRNSSDITVDDSKRDAAVRVRPLLNMLKLTGSRYVEVGRNLAVDEASVAARSKYARHIIVYNPRKPTGKYHFKLYMCCCATSWIALSFRLHCESTLQDRLENVADATEVTELGDELKDSAKTRQIVLEIVRPFYNSFRIVNCDNYYTSVLLLEALRLKGLYCRGTVKRLSKHFPRHVVLGEPNKSDKNSNKSKSKRAVSALEQEDDVASASEPTMNRVDGEVKRGDYLQAVSKKNKIVAASWCDGNIVTIISNADASTISTVTRLVKGKHIAVPAPTSIKEYNQHMQGVDRNDQVRARFSVADGHSFKKWYKKLGLAIIDIARVNAFLTRRLHRKEDGDERDSHRQFMIELIQEMISGRWQSAPSGDVMLFGEDSQVEEMQSPRPFGVQSPAATRASPSQMFSPTTANVVCSGVESSQLFEQNRRKRMCIICRFEGRNDTMVTEYCVEHKVCVCKRVYPEAANVYGCQRTEWTCWEKYHKFYLARDVFTASGCVRRASAIYKEKKMWESEEARSRIAAHCGERQPSGRSLSFAEFDSTSSIMEIFTPTPSFTGSVTPTPSFDYI